MSLLRTLFDKRLNLRKMIKQQWIGKIHIFILNVFIFLLNVSKSLNQNIVLQMHEIDSVKCVASLKIMYPIIHPHNSHLT
jgi:hypothetical protein